MLPAKNLLIDLNSNACYFGVPTNKGASNEHGQNNFSQVMEFLPLYEFRKCVARYHGDYKVLSFSCLDQFLCLAFAQLTYRESLRDIESCLRFMQPKLYHMGIRGQVSRNTLANANNQRDWRIYADFAQVLIHQARGLYREDSFGVDLENTVYALDSTTIDLCLSLFPWAHFRKSKGAIKLHTLFGSPRANPVIYRYHRREIRRRQYPRHLNPRGRVILHHGPRLSRLLASVCHASGTRNVHHPGQIQHAIPTPLLAPGRQNNGTTLRSNNSFNRRAIGQRLSTTTPFDQIFRFRNQQTFYFSDQQLRDRRAYRCATLQMPLESRTLFPLDQTAFAHQSFPGNIAKRRQVPGLDCNLSLRAGRHYQKTSQPEAKSLHNFTNFERDHFRQNAYIASTYEN